MLRAQIARRYIYISQARVIGQSVHLHKTSQFTIRTRKTLKIFQFNLLVLVVLFEPSRAIQFHLLNAAISFVSLVRLYGCTRNHFQFSQSVPTQRKYHKFHVGLLIFLRYCLCQVLYIASDNLMVYSVYVYGTLTLIHVM